MGETPSGPHHTPTPQTPLIRTEARIRRVRHLTGIINLGRRWRWDITRTRVFPPTKQTLLEVRRPIDTEHGYTTTWIGAAINAARATTTAH